MSHYDLTVIVPGVRNEHWETLYEHTAAACKRHSWEMIFSGPFALPESLRKRDNVKYIKNFGSPTRALHLGTRIADGKYFTWLSDDAHVYRDSLDQSLDLLLANDPSKDIICVRYCEGQNHSGACPPDAYWTAGYHPDLRCPAVDPTWRIPCVMMLSLEYYEEMGGLDCNFLHINMNVHDLAFRAQRNGSKVHLSPGLVMNCDWDPKRTAENSNVIRAFFEVDRPLFHELWAVPGERPIKIESNWRDCDPVWNMKSY